MSIYQTCDPGYELLEGEIKKNQLKKNKNKLMVFFNCFPTNDAN
jgi:hypothetical protein